MESSSRSATPRSRTQPAPAGRGPTSGGASAVAPSPDIRRVLLATDLSPASREAAEEAIDLAATAAAELIVLSVIEPGRLRLPGGGFVRRVDQERSRIENGTQMLVARARAAGVQATFLVWEGDPAEAILSASDAEDVDVIVIGSHGRGRIGRLVLGSVSTEVSERARRRVVIVESRPAGG
jgi:nucleotide-binding universal stress UspA family protein